METLSRLRWTSPRRRRVTNSEFVRQSGSQVTSEMWGTHGGAIRLALLKAGLVGCMYMALWSKVIYFFTISIYPWTGQEDVRILHTYPQL